MMYLLAIGMIALAGVIYLVYLIGMGRMKSRIVDSWVIDTLNMDAIKSDGRTITTKGKKSVIRVYEISGPYYDTMPQSDQGHLKDQRNSWYVNAINTGVTFRIFALKRPRAASDVTHLHDPVLQALETRMHDHHDKVLAPAWYVMATASDMARLDGFEKLMNIGMDGCKFTSVSNEDGALRILLNYIVTGEWQYGLPHRGSFVHQEILPIDMKISRDEAKIISWGNETRHRRIIGITGWPDEINGRFVGDLLLLNNELEILFACVPRSKGKLNARLIWAKTQFTNISRVVSGFDRQLDEFVAFSEILERNDRAALDLQVQIAIVANSDEELASIQNKILAILQRYNIQACVESHGLAISWYNRFPDARPLYSAKTVLSEFAATIAIMSGGRKSQSGSPWGHAPVRQFTGLYGEDVNFHFHPNTIPQSPGHFVVIGPTGRGKTVHIMNLLSGLAKYEDVFGLVLDSKRGAMATIEMLGGSYIDMSEIAFNPLDIDFEDGSHRNQLLAQLKVMAGGEISDQLQIDLQEFVELASSMPIDKRVLEDIFGAAFPKDSEANMRLAKWVRSDQWGVGQYRHVFNSQRDGVEGALKDGFLFGINMDEVLGDATLAPAIVSHISNRITGLAQSTNKKGFCIFVDEAAALTRTSEFAEWVKEAYQQLRKQDGIIGLAYQDPATMVNSGIGDIIKANSTTIFIFPDPTGDEDHYRALDLNDAEIAFVLGKTILPSGRFVLMIKKDTDGEGRISQIIRVDLDEKIIPLFASGVDANKRVDALKAQHGDHWRETLVDQIENAA